MIKKLFIVESPNDAAFIRLLIEYLKIQDADTQTIDATEVEHLHSFTGPDGKEKRGKTALPEKLEMLERDLGKKYPRIEYIGIILDVDAPSPATYGGKERSLELINGAIKSAFGYDPSFSEIGQNRDAIVVVENENVSLRFSCYLMLEGTRHLNLDEVLKSIAKKACTMAECLTDMSNCVEAKTGYPMADFDKQWVNYYIRCFASNRQLKDAEKRLSDAIFEQGAEIFDLDASVLSGLKNYLTEAVE